MHKATFRIIMIVVMLVLSLGEHHRALASTIPSSASVTWTVTKSYIVDKDNSGGYGCSDTWPGTNTQPLCTIGAAINLVKPGEGIFLRAGAYPGFTITKSGTSSGYITIASYQGEKVVVSGGSDTILIKGASYVRISGLEVTGAYGYHAAGIRTIQDGTSSPSYNIIENNLVHDNTGGEALGIKIEDGSYNKVVNNKVYNNYLSGIKVISHPDININGITGNEVVGNESYNNTLGGGDSDGITIEGPGTANTLVYGNIVHNNSDDGIDTWDSHNNKVIGNIAYYQTGPGDGNGFKLGGGGTGGYNLIVQNIAFGNKLNGFDTNGTGGDIFYNNVASNNNNFGFEDGWKNSPCTPSTCQETYINNIGYNNVRGNFSASDYTLVAHNNLWFSDDGSAKILYNYTMFSTLSAFYAASGNRLDNPNGGSLASLQANPQFTNAPAGTFSLLNSSPAINKGDPTNPGSVAAIDSVDIGAVEFNGSVASPTPQAGSPTPTSILAAVTSSPTLLPPTATLTFTPVVTWTVASTNTLPAVTTSPTSLPPTQTFTPVTTATVATTSTLLPPTHPPASPTPTMILPAFTATVIPATAAPQSVTIVPASETIYDSKNTSISYSSGWNEISDTKAYDQSYKKTSQSGSSLTLTFTGQSFSILYVSGPGYGSMNVYIDGSLVATINERTSTAQYQQQWDYSGQLVPGSHTLKLVMKKKAKTSVSVDAVIVR